MIRILRRPEVSEATGLGKSRIDELEREGKFPRRIRISTRATGWRSDEVEEWICSRPRAEEADADTAGRLRAAHAQRKEGADA